MTETYSKSVDFSDNIAPGQLHSEILAEGAITTTLVGIRIDCDVVSIDFASTISGSEKTALDGVVAAHVPSAKNVFITNEGYIEIDSSLADAQALRIYASNTAGGIDINAGTGGIAIDTTNALSLDAAAACNFTTTVGNLELEATNSGSGALINIDADSGLNIGSDASTNATNTTPINIGTSSNAKTLTIGNQTGATQTNLRAGTNGLHVDVASGGTISLDATGASCNFTVNTNGDTQDLNLAVLNSNDSSIILTSQGTGADAIKFDTTGGIDADATGIINIASGSNAGGAITLDASSNGGGITVSSGSQGVAINSNGGLIGIGHWSGGDMSIGTAAVARNITIGNTTGTTTVAINSGTWGITIGNNSNGGGIQMGNVAFAKTIVIGNHTGASQLFTRFGTGGNIKHQDTHIALNDSNATLTLSQLLTAVLSGTPSITRTLTLPTAANIVSGISGSEVNDCIDFTIINKSDLLGVFNLSMGTGGTMEGSNAVNISSSGYFRLRITNITGSSESYTVYRIA